MSEDDIGIVEVILDSTSALRLSLRIRIPVYGSVSEGTRLFAGWLRAKSIERLPLRID
jgi:hypothetical protein